MRILFVVGATSRIRNFRDALIELADEGHDIRLTGKMRKGVFELPPSVNHPRISGAVNPTQRTDAWRDFVDLLRGARDYVRYFDPRYGQATRLVRRAYEIAPTEFVLFCERHRWVKRHWKAAARALALCEELIPTDPGYEAFLRAERADLLLITPLVTFESYQTDYVKAAHRLGIPVVFIPFSWDNLTNKGLMRVQPDRVLVWNDVQQREAIELHGCRPDSITVTGAARFDDFFERTPATSREQFLAEHGLDPAKPMVLYLGSSQLTGPNEMELIRRWVESLRASTHPTVCGCNILIRPHPALRASWISVDMPVPNVAISLKASRNADQELFDSLFHAHAAVGLNTSAMLEAAIVGRPVHTLVIPGFDEGQLGTMHFQYLVEAYGGLATIARDFAEHERQLSEVLTGEPACMARSRSFAAHFLRPHGIDRRVSPILAGEIKQGATIAKRPLTSAPLWHAPARRTLLAWLRRRQVRTRTAVDSTAIGTSISLRVVRTALEEIQSGTSPVFVGPWNDSVANELLYWIPFLRWAAATYGIAPERLIVVSNGGAHEWYGSVAKRFLDARTLFSPPEIEHWSDRTVPQREQDYKQGVMSSYDAEIVDRAARAFDLTDYQVLHPSLLFRVVSRYEKDRALRRLQDVLRHEPLNATRPQIHGLPASFVAVSAAFTDALKESDENRDLLRSLIAEIAAEHDVVVVDRAPSRDIVPAAAARVHLISGLADGAPAAQVQTRVLAQSRAFVGAHGGLAVLASFCGVPAVTYHSERLPVDQVERLNAAAAAGWGAVSVERARRFKGVRLPPRKRP
jgi:hypothetical protein